MARTLAKYGFYTCLLFTIHFSLLAEAAAQPDNIEYAPPPLKIVPKDDINRLDLKTDLKDRTKLSLEMMNMRLSAAERLSAAQDFEGTYRELGVFHALMDDALFFLNRLSSNSGKVLDNYKRIDIALRGYVPRIEGIRREISLRYEPYVMKLMIYAREARTKATEPMFVDSIVPQRPLPKKPGN